jgi:hypothetical protein
MSKFETLFTSLYEDAAGITGAPSATTSVQANTTTTPTGATAQTPVTNTPTGFDQQHPLIQALAKTNDPAAVAKILQDNKVTLPPANQTTPTV